MNSQKSSLQKRFLLVDGNYFCHRLIHGIKIGQPDFNLDSKLEMDNFEASLNNSLISLFNTFNNDYQNLIDNIVFVFDNNSWRKNIKYPVTYTDIESGEEIIKQEFFKPYYIDNSDTTPLGYKENRIEQKEESSINYDNFHIVIRNFINTISPVVPVLDFEGAEGDDALYFISNTLAEKEIETIIFATDGDLKSLISKYTILFRNSKSKELPNGEFVISNYLFNKLYSEKSMMERFTQINIDNSYYNLLFNIDIDNGGKVKSFKVRKPNVDINVTEHYKNLIVKVISGDRKDNIFPIIRWNSGGAAKRNMRVTEKMIEKAFEMSLFDYDEKTCKQAFEDNKIMSQILINLRVVTKQFNAPLNKIVAHYKHNLLMNKLDISCIPDYVYSNYLLNLKEIENLLFQDLKIETLLKMNMKLNTSDSAKELIVNSIPENNQFNSNNPSNPNNQSNNPLVNEILLS